jgi:RNA-directed DNA polymerase
MSPDDPDLAEYWAWRRRKAPLPINATTLRRLNAQNGRCPICQGTLHADTDRPDLPDSWERWLAANHAAITTITTPDATGTDEPQHRLIHADCLKRGDTTQPPAPTANNTRPSRMR